MDDISVTEAAENPDVEEQMVDPLSKVDEIKEKQQELSGRLGQLTNEKAWLMGL